MSISKGGQSVKPYVGSKEVKEAYVGNQLVYKAEKLPYNYVYLGNENDYLISPLVVLGTGTTITKPSWATTYKLYLNYVTGNEIIINITPDFVGNFFKFLCRSATYNGSFNIRVYDSNVHYRVQTDYEVGQSETLKTTVNINANDKFISISSQSQIYFDAMRFENS